MLKVFQRIGHANKYLSSFIGSPSSNSLVAPTCCVAQSSSSLRHLLTPRSTLTRSFCFYYSNSGAMQSSVNGSSEIKPKPVTTALLDLGSGMPPPEILEASSRYITQAASSLFQHVNPIETLDYGPNPGPKAALEHLSNFLSRRYRTGVSADWLFTMAGSSHSLHFIPSILGPLPTGRVFVEQPTYMHALDIFNKDFSYDILPVETDQYGVVPDGFKKALENALTPNDVAASISSHRFASILYLQTAFANPGGYSLPRQRMVELEKIARQWNVLILADDVYSFTNFSELADMSPGTLNALPYLPSICTEHGEPSDHVLTLGSISKIVGPGLRFGWVVASPKVYRAIDESGYILSGGCANHYIAALVGQIIADGSADILTDLIRKELKSRFEIAHRTFTAHLPGNVSYTIPQGGYFVWVKVPKTPSRSSGSTDDDSVSLVQHLRDRFAVRVIDGTRCLLPQNTLRSTHWAIRVSMTALPQSELPRGLRTLADGICDYLGFKPTV